MERARYSIHETRTFAVDDSPRVLSVVVLKDAGADQHLPLADDITTVTHDEIINGLVDRYTLFLIVDRFGEMWRVHFDDKRRRFIQLERWSYIPTSAVSFPNDIIHDILHLGTIN